MLEDAAQLSDEELSQGVLDLLISRFEVEAHADPSVIVRSRPPALHVMRRAGLLTVRRGEGHVLLAGDLHTAQHPKDNEQPIPISVVRAPDRADLVIWQAYTPAVSAEVLIDDIVKTFLAHTSA